MSGDVWLRFLSMYDVTESFSSANQVHYLLVLELEH
jgi:hypothetical protein